MPTHSVFILLLTHLFSFNLSEILFNIHYSLFHSINTILTEIHVLLVTTKTLAEQRLNSNTCTPSDGKYQHDDILIAIHVFISLPVLQRT